MQNGNCGKTFVYKNVHSDSRYIFSFLKIAVMIYTYVCNIISFSHNYLVDYDMSKSDVYMLYSL